MNIKIIINIVTQFSNHSLQTSSTPNTCKWICVSLGMFEILGVGSLIRARILTVDQTSGDEEVLIPKLPEDFIALYTCHCWSLWSALCPPSYQQHAIEWLFRWLGPFLSKTTFQGNNQVRHNLSKLPINGRSKHHWMSEIVFTQIVVRKRSSVEHLQSVKQVWFFSIIYLTWILGAGAP